MTQRIIVKLKQQRGMHIYDGPGMHSDQINHNSSVIHLSSFQAFIVIYSSVCSLTSYENRYVCSERAALIEYGIVYSGKYIDPIRVHIIHSNILDLPKCNKTSNVWRIENKLRKEVTKGMHCVYKITAETEYVNLSITKMSYTGNDYYNEGFFTPLSCNEGSVAYEIKDESNMHTQWKHLCDNYTSNFTMQHEYV